MILDYENYDLIALDSIIESYEYDSDEILRTYFRPVEEALWACIECYGEGVNDYGEQLSGHLRRTSLDGMEFLVNCLGFSEKAGRNFHAANLFQDLGKIHAEYDPGIWSLPHRPTEDERAEKRKHAVRGPQVFAAALQDAPAELLEHPHITHVVPAIQLFHHERVDGSGIFGKTGNQMGLVAKAVCIVDAKDGDMVQRDHQDHARSEKEALDRMKHGEKYMGAFDDTLDIYIRYRLG